MKTKQLTIISILLLLILFMAYCQPAELNIDNKKPKNLSSKETTLAPYELPKDLPHGNASTLAQASDFAWKTFIAMNWPVAEGKAGVPDKNKKFGDEGAVVWETYKESFDIFRKNAEAPTAWGTATPLPSVCDENRPVAKVLRETAKISQINDFIDETEQAVGGILVDKYGKVVHYEVLMNQPMFDYVDQNQYYNALKQATAKTINFPVGSMELKASWRILSEKDDPSRYHTAEAYIYHQDVPQNAYDDCVDQKIWEQIEPCSTYTVGLVGLHIVYKTPSSPTFVWMTFEQVDNVEGDNPSFNDKKCEDCPPNTRFCYCKKQAHSQIFREYCIPDEVKQVNEGYQQQFKEEEIVWQYYKLVGVQWPTDLKAGRDGAPGMDFLGNTSMETFNQTASSCVGCHSFARSSNPAKLSDFSWVMGRAQKPVSETFGLPEPTGGAVLSYIKMIKPYIKWGTFPDTKYNTFSALYLPGENPHGKTTRIYLNDIAEQYAKSAVTGEVDYPHGSIILKENYRSDPATTNTKHPPHPSELVEITLFYKYNGYNPAANDWFALKSDINGLDMDRVGKVDGCYSCHGGWKGNADFMLTYNFDKQPVKISNWMETQICEQPPFKECEMPKDFNPK